MCDLSMTKPAHGAVVRRGERSSQEGCGFAPAGQRWSGLLAVAAVLSGAPAHADGPGWTANSTVKKLVVTSSGGVNVQLQPDVQGCTSQSGYGPNYASIYPSHPGINRIKADLLAA